MPERAATISREILSTCGQALAHCRGDRRSIRFEPAVRDLLPAAADELAEALRGYAEQARADCALLARLEQTGL